MNPRESNPRWLGALLVALLALAAAPDAHAQLDVCGCAGSPESLGAFDALDPGTYPPGTLSGNRSLQIPLPDDGVLIFDSFNLQRRPTDTGFGDLILTFTRNAANTPVHLLVAGDLTLAADATISVSGTAGVSGNNGEAGIGGLGGPGGFRGGDGAYQNVNFAIEGGAGLGPGGGAGGTLASRTGADGQFIGNVELRPLLGGGGGGGGGSIDPALGCSAGGGGGGGGAIVIAVNGTATLDGTIDALGGNLSGTGNSSCAGNGGRGGGGAIRITAASIQGTGNLDARGGNSSATSAGRITLEALSNTLPGNNTTPVAQRFPSPGPVMNPITPTARITSVAGALVPDPPQGGYGEVDILLAAPGPVVVDLATSAVPQGTTVDVTVKPRIGGAPFIETATLAPGGCNSSGDCVASVTVDLAAGAYTLEARATYQTP